jgi:hypothetical protein
MDSPRNNRRQHPPNIEVEITLTLFRKTYPFVAELDACVYSQPKRPRKTHTSLSKAECRRRNCCRHRKTQTELPRGTEGELGGDKGKTYP